MSQGRMVREGRLEDLISVENQTDIVLENASAEMLARIRELISASDNGAKLVSMGKPRTTLERLFLESTTQTGDSD
jgi:ABC-2 type transport system ATP-binding protein